ncbi:MAG: DnaJ domain-containing protein [Christensenellaceae bacterium]|jgi:DnaJ-class molecular chaperone|nr:DnaJ domain-containing protein [Christensenellaceae bacterium]
MENFYKILGVQQDASTEQIKDAYVTLVTKYHPDIYNGDKAYAEKYTAVLGEAYNTLKDEKKRLEYDKWTLKTFPHQNVHPNPQQQAVKQFVNTKRKTTKLVRILTSPFLYVPIILMFGALIVIVLSSYFI